jgi:hypothetical protein
MRRSTVIVVLLFLVMAGGYYFLNNRPKPADIALTLEPADTISYLFSSAEGGPTSIRVESKAGEVVELARNAENVWALTLPFDAAAEQGSAEAAASQITALRILDRLPNISPKDVGLDAPEYTLIVKFTNDVERIAEIGVITPTGSGYYVRTNNEIVSVSASAVDAIIGLLTNPPYAETPTASATPSQSPIPPTATNSPSPSSTPETGTGTNGPATPVP